MWYFSRRFHTGLIQLTQYGVIVAMIFFTVATAMTAPLQRMDLRQVDVGGEIGRRLDITINNNLMVVDVDKDFLKPFQDRKNEGGGYIGLGKFIDSLVRLAAYSHDDRAIERKKYVVEKTIATQEPDGYIGLFVPERRMWTLWDIHEMTYLVLGLTSDYHYFQEKKSLEAARHLMDYIIGRWTAEPHGMDQCPITVFMAVTGLEETLLSLHKETGDAKYLDFCVNFRKLPEWDYGIDLGRWGPIGGHAYAYFQRCLAQLRLYQLQPNPQLLKQTDRIMDFLLHGEGMTINGVCGQHECWHNDQDGTEGLGETCATAYYLRVLDELLRMKQDSLYGDIMERSIVNGLFAAQSPDGRKLRYYVPFEGPRVYFDGDTYCCPCNFRRSIAELPTYIYYGSGKGITVNLYTASETSVDLDNGVSVKIRQETDYPNSGNVAIVLEPTRSGPFPVSLRIPRWCEGARVKVNGVAIANELDGGLFFPIEREWEAGDRIELEMPMPFRLVKGRQSQAGRVAVMRGPVLFCLNPERNVAVKDLDLRQILIDPDTVEGPFLDASIRPDGLACKVKGMRSMGFSTGGNDLDLVFTEFPDPDGTMTYFRVRQMGLVGVDDELIASQ